MENYIELVNEMLEIDETKNRKLIQIDVDVPQNIKDTYQQVYHYFYKHLKSLEKELIGTKLFVDIMEPFNKYNLFDIQKMDFNKYDTGDYAPFETNLETYLRRNIKIAGGSISDLVIHTLLGENHCSKDIDIFVDKDLFEKASAIIGKKYYKGGKSSRFTSEKHYQEFVLHSIFSIDTKEKNQEDENSNEYNDEWNKTDYKFQYKGTSIDFVVQRFEKNEHYDVSFGFDFFFRAFSYDGKTVIGSQKSVDDILNRKLTVQTVDTPKTTTIRSYVFEKRYQFQLENRDKFLLYNAMIWKSARDLSSYYELYQKGLHMALSDTLDALTKKANPYKSRFSLAFGESLDRYNGKLTQKQFFSEFFRSALNSILNFEPWMDQSIREEIEKIYDFFSKKENIVTYININTLLENENIGLFKNRLDFVLDHKLYNLHGNNYLVRNLKADFNELFEMKRRYQEEVIGRNAFNDIEEIYDTYEIQSHFSDKKVNFKTYLHFLEDEKKNKGNPCSYRQLIEVYEVEMKNRTTGKNQERYWIENSMIFRNTPSITSETALFELQLDSHFLTTGEFVLSLRYLDEPVKNVDQYQNFIKPNHFYTFLSEGEDTGERIRRMKTPVGFIGAKINKDGVKITQLPEGTFLYLTPSRLSTIERTLTKRLSGNETPVTL